MANIRTLPSGHYQTRWKDSRGREFGQTFRTKREAQAKKNEVEQEMARGRVPDPSLGQQTLHSYIEEILDGDRSIRPSTAAKYRSWVKNHIIPALGERPLASIGPRDVRQFYKNLENRGVGIPTVRGVHNLLSRILGEAYRDGTIAENPTSRARLPKEERGPLNIPDKKQLEAIANHIDYRYRSMVLVAAFAGLRIGEVAALRIKHLDMDSGRLRIKQAAVETSGKVNIGAPKTKAGIRSVILPRHVIDGSGASYRCEVCIRSRSDAWVEVEDRGLRGLLESYAFDHSREPDPRGVHLHHHLDVVGAPDELDPEHLLFPSPACQPWSRTRFGAHYWRPALRRAGLEAIRFHDLRHFAVDHWIAQGVGARKIQARMGHASIRVTYDVYSSLLSVEEGGTNVARNEEEEVPSRD